MTHNRRNNNERNTSMKTAIIGSRGITDIDIGRYLPEGTDEIVSGGAKGVDTLAREFAVRHGIKLTEFLPDYREYRRGAPLKRNEQIVEYADVILAFWDGRSKGTKFVIDIAEECGKDIRIIITE